MATRLKGYSIHCALKVKVSANGKIVTLSSESPTMVVVVGEMNEPTYGFQVAIVNTVRERESEEVVFGPGFPPSDMAFKYMDKYQFVTGKGIRKVLQGDP